MTTTKKYIEALVEHHKVSTKIMKQQDELIKRLFFDWKKSGDMWFVFSLLLVTALTLFNIL